MAEGERDAPDGRLGKTSRDRGTRGIGRDGMNSTTGTETGGTRTKKGKEKGEGREEDRGRTEGGQRERKRRKEKGRARREKAASGGDGE